MTRPFGCKLCVSPLMCSLPVWTTVFATLPCPRCNIQCLKIVGDFIKTFRSLTKSHFWVFAISVRHLYIISWAILRIGLYCLRSFGKGIASNRGNMLYTGDTTKCVRHEKMRRPFLRKCWFSCLKKIVDVTKKGACVRGTCGRGRIRAFPIFFAPRSFWVHAIFRDKHMFLKPPSSHEKMFFVTPVYVPCQ